MRCNGAAAADAGAYVYVLDLEGFAESRYQQFGNR
jgi:hypothetical protein